MNSPVIVSFYTNDVYYANYAAKFIKQITQLNHTSPIKFKCDIIEYIKQPGEMWSSITFRKPELIRKWLDKHESIIWLDIDSTIHRLPILKTDLIIDNPYEIGAVSRDVNGVVCYDYLWYVKSTPITKQFFDDVITEINKNYRTSTDHKVREGGDHDAVLQILNKYKHDNPNWYHSIGDHLFGPKTGWATFGISGNEPPQVQRKVARSLLKGRMLRPTSNSRRVVKAPPKYRPL